MDLDFLGPEFCKEEQEMFDFDDLNLDLSGVMRAVLSTSDQNNNNESNGTTENEVFNKEDPHSTLKRNNKVKDEKAANITEACCSTASESNASAEEEPPAKRRSCRKREYNLRISSLVNRVETEKRREAPKQRKPKSKPPPLSKYRRKTANSRERNRMKEINDAFENLRLVVPAYPAENSKPTKITTLRLALNYIAALREMLGLDQYGNELSGSESGGDLGSAGNSVTGSSVSDSCSSPGSVYSPIDNIVGFINSDNSCDNVSGLSHDQCSLDPLEQMFLS